MAIAASVQAKFGGARDRERGLRAFFKGALFLLTVIPPINGCAAKPTVHEDVAYDDRFGEATTMDVYVPSVSSDDEAGHLHPGVMFIHGGAWRAGSKSEYTQAANRLARSGYVAATINYRLVGEGGEYPHAVQDCICALAHFRGHAAEYGLDPDRVAVMGYSAGGHLSSLLGVATEAKVHEPDCAAGKTKAPKAPRAVIVGAGAADLRGKDNSWVKDFLGGTEQEKPDNYRDASPITYVDQDKPPYLLIHGNADVGGNIDQARAMRDRLVEKGNDARVLQVSGGGHVLNATTDVGQLAIEEADLTPESWIAVMDFLDRTVGGNR